MGNASERECMEKIVNVKTKSSKKTAEIKSDFAKMQKLKAESLKKTEEMMHNAEHDLEKMEQDITKNKDLAPESRQRLGYEIEGAKRQIKEKYLELKKSLAAAIIPV